MTFQEHFDWLIDPKFRAQVKSGEKPMPAFWAQAYKMKLLSGIGVFVLVGIPWYAVMFAFPEVDDEGKLFWYRFLIHDHFNRLGAGVHTTTPGGSFTYFIEQGGYAIFPWVALLPGAVAVIARLKLRSADRLDHLGVIASVWLLFCFLLIGSSATKFHHYVFPMLPPTAILIALFIDRLWEEGITRHALSLIFGIPLFVLVGKDLASTPKHFTDLFVYNYDRPYPLEMVQAPIQLQHLRWEWLEGSFGGVGMTALFTLVGLGALALLVLFSLPATRSRLGRLGAAALLFVSALQLAVSLGARNLYVGDLLAAGLVAAGLYLLLEAPKGKSSPFSMVAATCMLLGGGLLFFGLYVGPKVPVTFLVGLVLALGAGLLGAEAARPQRGEKGGFSTSAGILGVAALALVIAGTVRRVAADGWFFSMRYGEDLGLPALAPRGKGFMVALQYPNDPILDRLMATMDIKAALGFAFALGLIVAIIAAINRAKTMMFASFGTLALGFALWFNWSHWVDLSHHWTQRDQFWRYYEQRRPGEPITAFLMNWRGETFYSRNRVKQIKDNGLMGQYANQPGREWALVEHNRLNILKSAVGADKKVTPIDRDLNNKFVLVTIE
jgi:hypothetical protein